MEEKYEQYHQKGGEYVIPTEVFNALLNEKEELLKFVEDLKVVLSYCKVNKPGTPYYIPVTEFEFVKDILSMIEEVETNN